MPKPSVHCLMRMTKNLISSRSAGLLGCKLAFCVCDNRHRYCWLCRHPGSCINSTAVITNAHMHSLLLR